MKIKLSLNFLELSKLLTYRNNPFNLLKIVNSLPNIGNWSFLFSSDNNQKTSLVIKADVTKFDEDKILNSFDGSIPELINCNEIIIDFIDKTLIIRDFKKNIKKRSKSNEINVLKINQTNKYFSIKLIDIDIKNFDKLSNKIKLFKNIETKTWFGSDIYNLENTSLKWKILTSNEIVYSKKLRETPNDDLPLELKFEIKGTKFFIKSNDKIKGKIFKHSKFGIIYDHEIEFIKKFKTLLKNEKLENYSVEIYDFIYTQKGIVDNILINEDIKKINKDLQLVLENNEEIKVYKNILDENKRNDESKELDIRLENISNKKKIYVDNEFYGNIPENEMSVIALFSKLEKSNKLPFYKFESFEFSPKGIDCIAKYKITQDDVIRTLPVEFEYQYKNFILHGHPTNHCEIVICWDLGMNPDNQDIENTDFNWLLFSKKSNLKIVLISKFSNIDLR